MSFISSSGLYRAPRNLGGAFNTGETSVLGPGLSGFQSEFWDEPMESGR